MQDLHKKLAFELVNSPQWHNYLKPLLEKKATVHEYLLEPFKTEQDVLRRQKDLSERKVYRHLISLIEHDAKKHMNPIRSNQNGQSI